MSLQEEVKISDDNTWLWLKLKFPMNSRIVISMRPCLKNSDLSHNVATLLQAHSEGNKTSAYSTTDDKVSSYPYSTHLTSSIQLQQHSSTVGLQSHKSKESQKLMAARFHEHFFHYKREKKKNTQEKGKKSSLRRSHLNSDNYFQHIKMETTLKLDFASSFSLQIQLKIPKYLN